MQLLPEGQVKLLGNFGSTVEQTLLSLRWRSGNLGGLVLSKADVEEMIAVAIRRARIALDEYIIWSGMY